MSYTYVPKPYRPYVPGQLPPEQQQQQYGNNNPNSSQPAYNPQYAAAPSPNAYVPYATPASAPAPASNYAGHSTAPAPAAYYAPSQPSAQFHSSALPSTRYTSHTAAPTSSHATTPDFSMALDVPPPQRQPTPTTPAVQYAAAPSPNAYVPYAAPAPAPAVLQGSAVVNKGRDDGLYPTKPPVGGSSYSNSYAPMATAVPAGASSSLNSSVYSGGPTNGLVSEGNPSQCHKVDYEIKGHEMQLVEIELDPSETIIAEAGAMMFLDDGIDFKTKFGDGSTPKQGFFSKLLAAGGRLLTGESLFLTHFTNTGHAKARVAFAAPFPGNIIPINMADLGGKLICQKDAFLCAAKGTKLSIHFNKKIGSGLFGGEGFILQKLEGDGMAFVHAGGTVIKRELRGDRVRLDTGCLVAFTDGITYDITLVPGLKSMFFGGEGLFLATLQGHGTVWMQSLPFSRMADRIIQSAPSAGGRSQGEGSVFLPGMLGNVISGNNFS